jgi:hypothetical protein
VRLVCSRPAASPGIFIETLPIANQLTVTNSMQLVDLCWLHHLEFSKLLNAFRSMSPCLAVLETVLYYNYMILESPSV